MNPIPLKQFKQKKGTFSYYKANNGNIRAVEGGVLINSKDIFTDSTGNQTVYDRHLHNTGLSIDEFVQHKVDYTYKIREIIEEKNLDEQTARSSSGMWYDFRINLDKLDILEENGFDPISEGGGLGGGLESMALLTEAIFIGNVIKIEKVDIKHSIYDHILTVSIDEVIKPSNVINNKVEIKILYNKTNRNKYGIPLNEPVLLGLPMLAVRST